MKKNNKGFTLIEMLAAIVILGLLFALAASTVFRTIESSRGKVYVSDAQKLIAQAEYKIKSSSSVIEKPSEGNCIVISLVFLDSSDFDTPPNDGEYLEQASYVVVKNIGTKLEYSATLIEKKKKGGYEGVYLSSNAALISGSVKSKIFDKSEIVYVETSDFDESYINKLLGENYCGEIERIYNSPDLADSSVQSYNSTPKITKATLTSASGKSYNSLDAVLSLKAEDNDSDRKELKVCISTTDYLSAELNCEPYGSEPLYTKNFNFKNYNGIQYGYDGSLITLYIVVKDPDGASTNKKIDYELHTNTAPVVDYENSGLEKRDTDRVNDTTAKFTLIVSDDVDTPSDLLVCFSEDNDKACESRSNYKTYKSYFGQNNYFYYTFNCKDRGLDGSSHYVTVYVEDSYGLAIEPVTFSYKFGTAIIPSFENDSSSNITLTPKRDNNILEGSKDVIVKFSVLEQLVTSNEIWVKIEELNDDGSVMATKVDKKYVPSEAASGYNFTFSSKYDKDLNKNVIYDGSLRTVRVTLYEHIPNNNDNKNIKSNSAKVYYRIHKNTEPEISDIKVTSTGSDLCKNIPVLACATLSSLSTNVSFKVSDDLGNSALKFCVSENPSDCSNTAIFKSYTPDSQGVYNIPYKFSGGEYPYDGSRKSIYVYAMDSYGLVSSSVSSNYVLYKNEPPKVDAIEVTSEGDINGSLEISVKPVVYTGYTNIYGTYYYADDIDLNKDLGYVLSINDTIVKSLTIEELKTLKENPDTNWDNIDTFDKLINQKIPINLSGTYDGLERTIRFDLYDQYNEKSTTVAYYKVYDNAPPEIDKFGIYEESNACESCDGGGYTVLLDLKVTDDMDSYDGLDVCITENLNIDFIDESCYQPYNTMFEDGYYSYTFSGENDFLPYRGQTKTLNAVVRDSGRRIAYSQLEYNVYINQAPSLDEDAEGPKVTSTVKKANSKDALFNVNVIDDFMVLFAKICYAQDGSEDYICTDDYVENNKFAESSHNTVFNFSINASKYQGQKYNVYASITDAYGESFVTDPVSYTIYNDVAPVVNGVQAVTGVTGLNTSQGVVSFSVKDYLDTYTVCVNTSNTSSGCNFVNKTFDGTTEDYYNITYDFGSNSKTDPYYLFVKDSNGKVSSGKLFTFGEYTTCASYNTSDEKCSYEFVSNGTYTQTDGKKVTISNNSKITQTRCAGKCYYWNAVYDTNGNLKYAASDTSGIVSYYKKTVSYKDRFDDNNYSCGSKVTYEKVTCGYIDCFYNRIGNYLNKAIGLKEYITDKEWTYTASDGTINIYDVGSHYFKMYTTSYKNGTNKITLTETNQRVPVDMIDEYNFDSEASTPYIRVLDEIDYDNFISN